MGAFTGKHVAVFVTGGIAAYKAATLVRDLGRAGATVRVAETQAATKFVTPLTFTTLTKTTTITDQFQIIDPQKVVHIDLADWADLAIVVPATADMIAKMAQGIADDVVSTTLLATTAPKFVVPAMNNHMYQQPATQRNLAQLKEDGVQIIEPATGMLAEGYVGKGRLPEPAEIVTKIASWLLAEDASLPLAGRQVVVTAGGTRELIDPVRFISNRSSGKMGFALAAAARDAGAKVTVITGNTTVKAPWGVKIVPIISTEDLQQALVARFATTDILIMAAAVSDFRPAKVADQKIKKQADVQNWQLELTKNPDIIAGLGAQKTHQFLVGFAAETQSLLTNAQHKLTTKKLDLLVANDVSQTTTGFNSDDNQVTILQPGKPAIQTPVETKVEIATRIIKIISQRLQS